MRSAHKEFIDLLNTNRFFEAHEVLERIWFPIRHSDHPEKQLLRGLINASVSFELIKRGRPEAAARVWLTYLKYRDRILESALPDASYYRKMARAVDSVHKKFEDIYG